MAIACLLTFVHDTTIAFHRNAFPMRSEKLGRLTMMALPALILYQGVARSSVGPSGGLLYCGSFFA